MVMRDVTVESEAFRDHDVHVVQALLFDVSRPREAVSIVPRCTVLRITQFLQNS